MRVRAQQQPSGWEYLCNRQSQGREHCTNLGSQGKGNVWSENAWVCSKESYWLEKQAGGAWSS
jgi:hypothetical protein